MTLTFGTMRYIALLLLIFTFIACQKREEFRTNPDVNHSVEAALEHNIGPYFAKGKIGTVVFDSMNVVLSRSTGNHVKLSSSSFPTLTFAVNSLTDYSTHSVPGGSGLDLVSASPGIEFSIVNFNMVLKYQNASQTIEFVGKKL